jgi:hypothetical protein
VVRTSKSRSFEERVGGVPAAFLPEGHEVKKSLEIYDIYMSRQEQKPDFWVQNLKKVRVEKIQIFSDLKKFIQVYK